MFVWLWSVSPLCNIAADVSIFQDKCGGRVKEVWPYIKQEIKPTLDELGILTPEEMGYDRPELALKDVYDM